MREQPYEGLSLFGPSGNRKYLNAAERRRFVEAARRAPPKIRLFCLTLRWSGARISEVLALTPAAIDIESGVASIQTLKRRKRGIVRQVPLPPIVLHELDRVFKLRIAQRDPQLATARLWRWSRTTAWRYVKAVMAAAGITGTPGHAERLAAWLRRQRLSIQRAAASCSALARACFAAHHGDLRRCCWPRRALVRGEDVGRFVSIGAIRIIDEIADQLQQSNPRKPSKGYP